MLALFLLAVSVSSLVDPFWGSEDTASPVSEGIARTWNWEKAQTGNTHPGAVLPFGWVSACAYSGGYPTGYGRIGCSSTGLAPEIYSRNFAYGISHFHQSGTGWIGKFYNYLLVTPSSVGVNTGKASRLDDEVAQPGYYAARLTDYRASFEVVPCRYAACHRYHFDSTNAHLLVDASNLGLRREYVRLRRSGFIGERVEKVSVTSPSPGEWEGTIRANGRDLHYAFLFCGKIGQVYTSGVGFDFAVIGDSAEAFIGFSLVSVEEARARAVAARTLGFDAVRTAAATEWENILSRMQVRFADARLERRFYSTLYHSLVKPTDCGTGYVDFSTFWDIYRTQLPLVLSLAPNRGRGIVEHLMSKTEQNGFSPICQIMDDRIVHKDMQATALPLYTLTDAFFRGVLSSRDYPRMKRVFEKELAHADVTSMSPTHQLDLSGAREAVAEVAQTCGDGEYAATMRRLAREVLKAYDPKTGLLSAGATYYEGNHWNYSFRFHPAISERIALAGGVEGFVQLLDRFFGYGEGCSGWNPENDRIRRVNHFEGLNNESDMDAPYAYLWCGRADRTAEIVDLIRRCRFTDGRGGCPGNNDSGATSSWYVWNCLGIYPLTGTPYYLLATPSVESATIQFARGNLQIKVERESPYSIYPLAYEFNGRKQLEPRVKVSELERGGKLVFRLSDHPHLSTKKTYADGGKGAMVGTVKAVELAWGKTALAVDGDFSDWGKMAWRADFQGQDRQPVDDVKCRFALKRDRENLYIAWRTDGAYKAAEKHVRHDGDIWRGNSVVEFFFGRPASANGYMQFAVAANGDRMDGEDGDAFVTPDWEVATKTDSQGWQAELKIPFKSLERKNYKFRDMIRMNICMGLPKKGDPKGPKRAAIWSLNSGSGYKDVTDMGYVALYSFQAESERQIEEFAKAYGENPKAARVAKGDERGFVKFLSDLESERAALDRRRVEKIAARLASMPDLPPLLVQPWDEDQVFGEKPAAQANVLEFAIDQRDKPMEFDFESAINETTHRAFVLSAPRATDGVTFALSDLRDGETVIPSAALNVARLAFLHPPVDIRKDGRELNLAYPEIVERVLRPQSFRAGESALFRLYLDTRGVKSGNYVGELAIKAGGKIVSTVRISAHVCNLELPLPETHPFDSYIFTTMPWGGESAELWARFFRDHYLTDVSFEHPTGYLDGKPLKDIDAEEAAKRPKPKTREEGYAAYAKWMTDPIPVPEPGRLRFDLTAFQMNERLRACVKYGLNAVVSSRAGHLKSEYFPAMMAELAKVGVTGKNFIYKLGDEDRSLVYLPVAKRLRELVPDLRTTMIPSGASYWDIKPAAEGFTDFTFSSAAFRGVNDEDVAHLRAKGVRVSRYTNRASWAGRTLPIQSRGDPWDVLISGGLDGYACWTAGLRPNIDFATGYSGYNKKYKIYELPPERQIATMLVYIRRDGDVYRPVSCIRLENIRDGFIDALYYRLVKERAAKTGDKTLAAALAKIVAAPRRTYADYDRARSEMRALLICPQSDAIRVGSYNIIATVLLHISP